MSMEKSVHLESVRLAIHSKVSERLEGIREELDEHLEVINENTREIQDNHEYVMGLERRLIQLQDQVNSVLDLLKPQEKKEEKFSIIPLTTKEKDVFMALYIESENKEVTYKDLANMIGCSEQLVASYIGTLIEKAVPVLKRYAGKVVHLKLSEAFRQVQAKENIVGINTKLTHWIR